MPHPFDVPMYEEQYDEVRIFDLQNEKFIYLGEEIYRSPFYRDYGRLIHCPSFRRLHGKCQLFPGSESDFFRNRLTHSIEVAQIAKAITNRLNWILSGGGVEDSPIKHRSQITPFIDTDLVSFAGMAHDLGHSPFGHQGEEELNNIMKDHGGFEGNAQTLRLLCRIEKKTKDDEWVSNGGNNFMGITHEGEDKRKGLNLTTRALASILKYDHEIGTPIPKGTHSHIEKGYYRQERDVVAELKKTISRGNPYEKFKTVEMQIMEFADDIAYSVYDLEDSMKGGFITGLDLVSGYGEIFEEIAVEVSDILGRSYTADRLYEIIQDIFRTEWPMLPLLHSIPRNIPLWDELIGSGEVLRMASNFSHQMYRQQARNGYYRNYFTSWLVGLFVRSINIRPNRQQPAFSEVLIDTACTLNDHNQPDVDVIINVLKRFTYKLQIQNSRLKIVEQRGKHIVRSIFDKVLDSKGEILPEDFKYIYKQVGRIENKNDREWEQYRTICDFIACMTDKYAVEFYGRLNSERPMSIFTFF